MKECYQAASPSSPAYRLVRSRRKTLQISVENNGALVVRAPLKLSMRAIEGFIMEKADWIAAQQAQAARRLAAHPPHRWKEGERVWLLGEPLHILVEEGAFAPYCSGGALHLSSGKDPGAQAAKWFCSVAREKLPQRAQALAKQFGFVLTGVRITSAKGRYGSCNRQNGINLSWRIVMAPPETVDAIILHELCHTKEHNHSRRFWNLVLSVCPDYHARFRWLEDHGLELVSLE